MRLRFRIPLWLQYLIPALRPYTVAKAIKKIKAEKEKLVQLHQIRTEDIENHYANVERIQRRIGTLDKEKTEVRGTIGKLEGVL